MSKNTKLSIVVLTWNGGVEASSFIESFRAHPPYHTTELILVDNASTDGTLEMLKEFEMEAHPANVQVKLISNPENLGYAQGNNIALPHISGDYTLFLNQDIVLTEGVIDELVKFLEEDRLQEYGAISPQLRYPDGAIQKSVRKLPTPKSMIVSYLKMNWDDEFDYSKSQNCQQPMASAIMIRTDLLQKIGGFDIDPMVWLFFNDVDLSKKIIEEGYKIYYFAEGFLYHGHGQSTKKVHSIKKLKLWHQGMYYYFRKWHVKKKRYIPLLALGTLISFVGLFVRNQVRKHR
jgi:N-acetylglucosaminyl-diphospho-decaprenol L-rhamnosyltransferase